MNRDFTVVRRRANLVDILTPKQAGIQGYRLKANLNFDGATFSTLFTGDIGTGFLDPAIDTRVLQAIPSRDRVRMVFDPDTFSGAPWNLVDTDHFWLQFFPVDFAGVEGTGGARTLILPDDEMRAQGRVIIAGQAPLGLTVANSLRLDLPFRMRNIYIRNNAAGAVAATGVLSFAANPANTETVIIDGKTYTFEAGLTNVDGHVQIGGTTAASVANLVAAITLTGNPGVDYALATTLHPSVTAAVGAGDTMDATAKIAGFAGNSIATTETLAAVGSEWGAPTLLGGTDTGGGVDLMVATMPGGAERPVAAGEEAEFFEGATETLLVRGDGAAVDFTASMTHLLPL